MTLSSIALHFRPIRWASQPDRQPPSLPQCSPRRLMKKTSAGIEKVAHPVCFDLAVSVLSLTGFDASGVAGSLAVLCGWAGRTFLIASLLSQPEATTLLFSNLPTSNLLPSLPAPLLLNYNNSNNNLIYPVLKRPE